MEKEFQKFPVLNIAQKQQLKYLQVEFLEFRRNIRKMNKFPLVFLCLLCGCAARIDEINVNRWQTATRPEAVSVVYSMPLVSCSSISILRMKASRDYFSDVEKLKVEAARRGANQILIEPDQEKGIICARCQVVSR